MNILSVSFVKTRRSRNPTVSGVFEINYVSQGRKFSDFRFLFSFRHLKIVYENQSLEHISQDFMTDSEYFQKKSSHTFSLKLTYIPELHTTTVDDSATRLVN